MSSQAERGESFKKYLDKYNVEQTLANIFIDLFRLFNHQAQPSNPMEYIRESLGMPISKKIEMEILEEEKIIFQREIKILALKNEGLNNTLRRISDFLDATDQKEQEEEAGKVMVNRVMNPSTNINVNSVNKRNVANAVVEISDSNNSKNGENDTLQPNEEINDHEGMSSNDVSDGIIENLTDDNAMKSEDVGNPAEICDSKIIQIDKNNVPVTNGVFHESGSEPAHTSSNNGSNATIENSIDDECMKIENAVVETNDLSNNKIDENGLNEKYVTCEDILNTEDTSLSSGSNITVENPFDDNSMEKQNVETPIIVTIDSSDEGDENDGPHTNDEIQSGYDDTSSSTSSNVTVENLNDESCVASESQTDSMSVLQNTSLPTDSEEEVSLTREDAENMKDNSKKDDELRMTESNDGNPESEESKENESLDEFSKNVRTYNGSAPTKDASDDKITFEKEISISEPLKIEISDDSNDSDSSEVFVSPAHGTPISEPSFYGFEDIIDARDQLNESFYADKSYHSADEGGDGKEKSNGNGTNGSASVYPIGKKIAETEFDKPNSKRSYDLYDPEFAFLLNQSI